MHIIHICIYMCVYVFKIKCLRVTQLSCDDRENVYFILLLSSNRKYESLTHCLG